MYNKKIILSIIISLSLGMGMIFILWNYFSKKPYHFKTPTQLILIAIDELEPSKNDLDKNGTFIKNAKIDATSTDLLTALYQEQCVIIVTASVV